MSGLFGSSLIKGTRITDFGTTTAEIGIPLPFGYGRAPYDGNVIFCPMPPVEQRHVTRQGKGGVKQESFTYSLSYSISFMKGQCYGWWWIKRNGKVVWTMDPNAPIEDQAYAQKWAEKVNFHYGTADQMPDAVIESYEGAGNVSAFRNLTYFTVEDDDVTDGGGAVPSYEACLIASPPEAYLTSKVYPQKLTDAAELGLAPAGGALVEILKESALQPSEAELGALPVSGKLQEPPPIPMEPSEAELGMVPEEGALFEPPPGEWFSEAESGMAPSAGRLAVPPSGSFGPDALDMGMVPTAGSLFTAAYLGPSLFHFEGDNDSTDFVDEHGKVWVPNGNVRLSTTQSRFGSSSAYFDGQGDFLSPSMPDMTLDNTVATVELWAWLPDSASWPIPTGNASALSSCIVGQSNTGRDGEQEMGVSATGALHLSLNRGNANNSWSSPVGAVPWEEWVHLAFVIDTAQVRGYVNGVQVFSANTARKWAALGTPFRIGHSIVTGYPQYKRFWNGYMDELRIRREVVYTANFTPPSSPFAT